MKFERKGIEGLQSNGVWGGLIVFSCPWAHPVWSEYFLTVVDLTTPLEGAGAAFLKDPKATHEFLLFAVNPKSPVDFDEPADLEKLPPNLIPANHGYQFTARSNDAAWARVNALVDDCMARMLSPDTDWRSAWDARMADGWTLLMKFKPETVGHA